MTGRVVPELVAGAFEDILTSMWSASLAALRTDHHICNLPSAEQSTVIRDFELARATAKMSV